MHSRARTLLTSPPFVASAAESLLFELCVKPVRELHSHSGFGGDICLRMGYPIAMYITENPHVCLQGYFRVRREGWVFAGDVGERSTLSTVKRPSC